VGLSRWIVKKLIERRMSYQATTMGSVGIRHFWERWCKRPHDQWCGAGSLVGSLIAATVAVADPAAIEWGEVPSARKVVLLVHGLNNTPAAMRPLGERLRALGFTTGIVALTGHGDGSMRSIAGFETWIADVRAAARAAMERYPGKPLVALGFSLGAAVILAALEDSAAFPATRLVLLSPAVTLKGYAASLRVVSWLGIFGLSVPSVIPDAYRSSVTTPLAYYAHLFRLIERLLTKPPVAAWNEVPALVISSAGDELVSHRRWDRYVRELGLTQWQHLVLPATDTDLPGHLLLDEPSFGSANWVIFEQRLTDFLTDP